MWEKYFTIADRNSDAVFTVWRNQNEQGRFYYQIKNEKDQEPPDSDGGYLRLSTLLNMRGL